MEKDRPVQADDVSVVMDKVIVVTITSEKTIAITITVPAGGTIAIGSATSRPDRSDY
jgi:hypothetical protein